MVIAVSIVGIVQMAINEVACVVTMGNRFMATARSMDVVSIMTSAIMTLGTGIGVHISDLDDMLIHVIPMGMVKVPIVEVVDVVNVLDSGVATVWTMGMIVILMNCANHRRLQSIVSFVYLLGVVN